MPQPLSRSAVLALYGAVLRMARAFPDRSIGRKLQFNARELIQLRRDESDQDKIAEYIVEGRNALHVYEVLRRDPELLRAITRKEEPILKSQ